MSGPARRGILAAAGALATVPGAALTALPLHTDAELLRLGAELDEALARQNAAWAASAGELNDEGPLTLKSHAAFDECGGIVDRIELVTATTLAGLLVKAKALAWCRSDDPMTAETFGDHPTTDVRITASILADLRRLGGAE